MSEDIITSDEPFDAKKLRSVQEAQNILQSLLMIVDNEPESDSYQLQRNLERSFGSVVDSSGTSFAAINLLIGNGVLKSYDEIPKSLKSKSPFIIDKDNDNVVVDIDVEDKCYRFLFTPDVELIKKSIKSNWEMAKYLNIRRDV